MLPGARVAPVRSQKGTSVVPTPLDVLQSVFGFRAFRKGQQELLEQTMAGRDVLGIMPTGAGKSLCYQVPALLFDGLTVVLSPLISLMKDQVDALRGNGVAAEALHSALDREEGEQILRRVRSGQCRLLYIAPERLENAFFLHVLRALPVALFVVDEAHCVSQWGHDFRPSYLRIAPTIATWPQRPPVAAFTATATPEVRDDMVRKLGLLDPFLLTTGFDRENLFFRVERPRDKMAFLLAAVKRRPQDPGIVYAATRKVVEEVCDALRRQGIAAVRYHAGLDEEERRKNQEAFLHDRATVMVATNAFGMGIDKSNVRYVLHYNMPKSIDSYYQEAGRAGRDGEPGDCTLLYAPRDIATARFLIRQGGNDEGIRTDLKKLQSMVDYCAPGRCLRHHLLQYFGEQRAASRCGSCSNCTDPVEYRDITVEAKKVLSCVYRMEERTSGMHFGASLLIQVLRGSRDRRLQELGFDTLSTWGLLKDVPREELRDMVDFLVAEGYLALSEDAHATLGFTAKSRPFLRSTAPLLWGRPAPALEASLPPPDARAGSDEREDLFEALRTLRREIAEEQGVPPYVVFPDSTLRGMCRRLPLSPDEFLDVPGVGHTKLERYGDRFLALLRRWIAAPGPGQTGRGRSPG